MNIKFTLLILCLSFILLAASNLNGQSENQNKCRSGIKYLECVNKYPQVAQVKNDLEHFTEEWISKNYQNLSASADITIPIVVHVLWLNADENISDEQIMSQIDVLNKDFNKLNDNWETTPEPFKSLVANIGIEFCLASIDPEGNLTSGITRRQVTTPEIGETQDFYQTSAGGQDPWDNNKYINVWLANQMEGSLGFATFPGTAMPPASDGIVIPAQYWGTTGTAANSAPNNLGKTATHEFGHYFNLSHLWGDESSGCDIDDNVSDTPLQFTESGGCPTFPLLDDCTSSGSGVMFMNFMDYADDACMSMFSEGQKARLLAALNGPRASLLESDGCGIMTSVYDLAAFTKLKVYPNPSSGVVNIDLNSAEVNGASSKLRIINVAGKVVNEINISLQRSPQLRLNYLPNGLYFIEMETGGTRIVEKLFLHK